MSAFPDPACRLPGEAAFLSAVLDDLSDDTRKLVYADWLEEQGDPRGAYLRAAVADLTLDGSAFPKPWRDLCGLTLAAEATRLGLDEHLPMLQRLSRPALVMTAERADESALPIGVSKLGGRPDLPWGMDWPGGSRGPFSLLAQIDLTELATSPTAVELPASGWLWVFYDIAELYEANGWDTADCRVLHRPGGGLVQPGLFDAFEAELGGPTAIARRDRPEGMPADYLFQPCRLRFTETLTLLSADRMTALEPPESLWPKYRDLLESPGLGHRLLGHPHPLQNDPLVSDGDRHLLTIDSDTNPGWMWGDAGLLYFTLPAADLAAGRFDEARVEFQCC